MSGQYLPHEGNGVPLVNVPAGEDTIRSLEHENYEPTPEEQVPAVVTETPHVGFPPEPPLTDERLVQSFKSAEEIESALRGAETVVAEEFHHETTVEQLDNEQQRLLSLINPVTAVRVPKGKKVADDLIEAIALQMVRQAEGEAAGRAVEYINSLPRIKEFLDNTLSGYRLILAILRDCEIKVPLDISFDPATRQLERRFLDFTAGDTFTIEEITKGLIYLNSFFGPNSRIMKGLQEVNARTTALNNSLTRQLTDLSEQYTLQQVEVTRLQAIERKYVALDMQALNPEERQYIIFRAREVPAKLTHRQRRERKQLKRMEREFIKHNVMPPHVPMRLEHEPATVIKETWIGLGDRDLYKRAVNNELEPDQYEVVTTIGEALKFKDYASARAVLDKLIAENRRAQKKKKSGRYQGPKNPHRFGIYQIVMRKV